MLPRGGLSWAGDMGTRRTFWLLAVAVATVVFATGGCSSAPTASHPVQAVTEGVGCGAGGSGRRSRGQSGPARASVLALRVGALFVRDGNTNHFCTASVVTSPDRDLLITAAHCINGGKGGGGYRQDIVFIPGYRDG